MTNMSLAMSRDINAVGAGRGVVLARFSDGMMKVARALLLLGVLSELALLIGATDVATCATGSAAVAVVAGYSHSCAVLVRKHCRRRERHHRKP